MITKSLKAKLRASEVIFGPILLECATPGVAVTLADVGFDFVLIDLEHSPFDTSSVARTILAGNQAGLSSIIKVPNLERSWIQRFLDYGAAGMQVPHIESADELACLARWMRYPPHGQRGFASGLASTGFRLPDPAKQIKEADENTLMIPMIETRTGVDKVESILDAAQPDLLYLGASDLSSSYGVPGQLNHKLVVEAAQHVIDVCRARQIAVGINAEDLDSVRHWISRGVQMIAYSSDLGMFRSQANLLLKQKASLLKP